MASERSLRIPSATGNLTGSAGFVAFLLLLPLTSFLPWAWHWLAFLLVAGMTLAMVLVDVLVYKTPSRQLTTHPRAASPRRVIGKLLALYCAIGLIYLDFHFIAIPHTDFFKDFFKIANVLGPVVAVAAIPYFWWLDRRQLDPLDEYHHAATLFTTPWREVDWTAVGQFCRAWMVKGFFLPLMSCYLIQNVRQLGASDILTKPPASFVAWYDFLYTAIFTLDLAFVVIGYALPLRVLDTHIRSTEPTLLGWSICLICYAPFYQHVKRSLLNYEDGYYWGDWLGLYPNLKMVWGCTILALLGVYVWASVVFGCRFSNLTHRGILTNGPYRWLRHPAYVSKNLSWWLISIPFISKVSVADAVLNCLQLGALNCVYLVRAWTEERHLSKDPDYRAYRDWMRANGLVARLRRRWKIPPDVERPI